MWKKGRNATTTSLPETNAGNVAFASARAAVLELVADLVARIERADAGDGGAALEGGEVRDHELRAVDEIDGDPVALSDTELRQSAGEPVDGIAELAIGDAAAVENQRIASRPPGCRLVEELEHRARLELDGRRYSGLVELHPRPREVELQG